MLNRYKLILVLISLGLFALYSSQLSSNFIGGMDDDWGIYENSLVQKLNKENLKKIWLNETFDLFYLPTTFTSFAIDVALWGNNALLMKLENLILFIICGFLIFHFLSLVGVNPFVSFSTTLLFLTHPFQLESIALATGRRQVLLLFFLLITCIYLYKFIISIGNKKYFFYFISLSSFFLALGSKPQGLMLLPFIVVLFATYEFNNNRSFKDFKRILLWIVPFVFLAFVFLFINSSSSDRNFLQQDFGYSFIQHLLIVCSSFGFYIPKIFTGDFSIFYPVSPASDFNYLLPIINSSIALSLVLLCLILYFNKKYIQSFSLLWYLLFLVPSSLLIYLYSDFPFNTADRYFFIASPGIFLFISVLIDKLSKYKKIVLLSVLSIFFVSKSYNQLKVWDNSISLFNHNVNHYPNRELLYRIAIIHYKKDEIKEAYEALDKANNIDNGIKFNNTFYFDLEIAYLYQQKGEIDHASDIVHLVLKRDIDINESEWLKYLNQEKVKSIFPLSQDQAINIERYLALRNEILDISGGKLKDKRL